MERTDREKKVKNGWHYTWTSDHNSKLSVSWPGLERLMRTPEATGSTENHSVTILGPRVPPITTVPGFTSRIHFCILFLDYFRLRSWGKMSYQLWWVNRSGPNHTHDSKRLPIEFVVSRSPEGFFSSKSTWYTQYPQVWL